MDHADNHIPVYYRISESLRSEIFAGHYQNGNHRLPSEKELAERFHVNRHTIRKAIDKLGMEGVVRTINGRGTFVIPGQNAARTVLLLGRGVETWDTPTMQELTCTAMVTLKKHGFYVELESMANIDKVIEAHRSGLKPVNGFLVLRTASQNSAAMKKLAEVEIPLVVEGTAGHDFDYVEIDNNHAMETIIDYLYQLGHRRIGLTSYSQELSSWELGYLLNCAVELLQKRNCYRKEWICLLSQMIDNPAYDSIELHRYLEQPELPTAVICLTDFIAVNMLHIAKVKGFAVPEKLSITGFDDTYIARFAEPQLTSMENRYWELGQTAAELLVQQITDYQPRHHKILLRQQLAIRRSCAAPSVLIN